MNLVLKMLHFYRPIMVFEMVSVQLHRTALSFICNRRCQKSRHLLSLVIFWTIVSEIGPIEHAFLQTSFLSVPLTLSFDPLPSDVQHALRHGFTSAGIEAPQDSLLDEPEEDFW